jgi:hypothetical protein
MHACHSGIRAGIQVEGACLWNYSSTIPGKLQDLSSVPADWFLGLEYQRANRSFEAVHLQTTVHAMCRAAAMYHFMQPNALPETEQQALHCIQWIL